MRDEVSADLGIEGHIVRAKSSSIKVGRQDAVAANIRGVREAGVRAKTPPVATSLLRVTVASAL